MMYITAVAIGNAQQDTMLLETFKVDKNRPDALTPPGQYFHNIWISSGPFIAAKMEQDEARGTPLRLRLRISNQPVVGSVLALAIAAHQTGGNNQVTPRALWMLNGIILLFFLLLFVFGQIGGLPLSRLRVVHENLTILRRCSGNVRRI